MVGPLFEDPDAFDRDGLARKLRAMAAESIFVGGSSWKYEGWLGQIYSRERYLSRGRFSKKIFEQECLREYAETFPIVCGDFAFYQFPTEEFWRKLFGLTPSGFRFAFKVPEQITCKMFPVHDRYGAQALAIAIDEALDNGAPHPHAVRHVLEKRRQDQERYRITVRFRDGREATFEQDSLSGIRVGDRVRVDGDRLARN